MRHLKLKQCVCVAWLRTPEKFTNVHLIINEKWFVFWSGMKNHIISKRSINNSS